MLRITIVEPMRGGMKEQWMHKRQTSTLSKNNTISQLVELYKYVKIKIKIRLLERYKGLQGMICTASHQRLCWYRSLAKGGHRDYVKTCKFFTVHRGFHPKSNTQILDASSREDGQGLVRIKTTVLDPHKSRWQTPQKVVENYTANVMRMWDFQIQKNR